ncbi:hypothetical protein HK104_011132, partial [Borealophlyctis nickersoniae]
MEPEKAKNTEPKIKKNVKNVSVNANGKHSVVSAQLNVGRDLNTVAGSKRKRREETDDCEHDQLSNQEEQDNVEEKENDHRSAPCTPERPSKQRKPDYEHQQELNNEEEEQESTYDSDGTFSQPSSEESDDESDKESEDDVDREQYCLDFLSGLRCTPDVVDDTDPKQVMLSSWRQEALTRASKGNLKFTRGDMFEIGLLYKIILNDVQNVPAHRSEELKGLLSSGDDTSDENRSDDEVRSDDENNLFLTPKTTCEDWMIKARRIEEAATLRALEMELASAKKREKKGEKDTSNLIRIIYEMVKVLPKDEPVKKQDEMDYILNAVAPLFEPLKLEDDISLKWNNPSTELGHRKKKIDRMLHARKPDLTIVKSKKAIAHSEIKTPFASQKHPHLTCYDCFQLMQFMLEDNGAYGIHIFGGMLFLYIFESLKNGWLHMRRITSVPIPRTIADISTTIGKIDGFLQFI